MHLPGGLPMSAILACIIFAAVSGSSPATVVAIGSVMFLAIQQAGYPKSYAVGAITSAGSLGILIPPSVVMIVYGVTASGLSGLDGKEIVVSIEALFKAGIIPGLMIGGMMMLWTYIGAAVVFAHFLTSERIPHHIAEYLIAQNMSWWVFLIAVNILLCIMGQFMEPSSVVMIMTPLLLPIAVSLGIDPVHFGIIMVVNMEIGMITPPVGLNLFVASSLTGMDLKNVVVSILPWLVVMVIGLALVTYIPQISLWLVR